MAPPQPGNLGERLSGLEAKVDGFERYEHERWHALHNTLQPLVGLPLQLTRDIAKIQGTFDGRIASITKEIERSITAAVEKAIEPVSKDIADLKTRIVTLEAAQNRDAGAKSLAILFLRSPIIRGAVGATIAAAAVAWAFLTGKVPA